MTAARSAMGRRSDAAASRGGAGQEPPANAQTRSHRRQLPAGCHWRAATIRYRHGGQIRLDLPIVRTANRWHRSATTACGSSTWRTASPAPVVSGIVVDADNKPVAVADVACGMSTKEIASQSTRTNADGKFQFKLPPRDFKTYWITLYAGKIGFAPASAGGELLEGNQQRREFTIKLANAGTISGTCNEGKPVWALTSSLER